MTVKELLVRIDSREITEWMAYYRLEPFGEWRADMRAGIIASTIANVNRRKGSRAYKPEDFMPKFFTGRRTQSLEQQKQMLKMWADMAGKKSKTKG